MAEKEEVKKCNKGEEKFHTLSELTSDLVIIVNRDGNIIDCNSKINEFLGFKKKEAVGNSIFSLLPPENIHRLQQSFEESVKTGKITGIGFKFFNKEGKIVAVLLSISTMKNSSDFIFLCVAERCITEDNVSSPKNQSSEDFYNLLNSFSDPTLIQNENGILINANNRAKEFFGIELDCKRNNFGNILDYSETLITETKEIEMGSLENKCKRSEIEPILYIPDTELSKIKNDGSLSFKSDFTDKKGNKVEIEIYRKITRLGGKGAILSVIKDVTVKNRTEGALLQLNEVLRLINKILSHDILNDLTVVSSSLEMFVETNDKKFLENAKRSVNSSIELIKDMKELESLIHSGEALKPIKVEKILNSVARNYSFDIRVHPISERCEVLANKALASVIDNIIRNAIIHSGTDKIEITATLKDNFCEIRIADFGKGISDELKKKVFEEGFSYGETGNSGIGLYIVKKTVEKYGGDVSIKDNSPTGCIFVLKLRIPNP